MNHALALNPVAPPPQVILLALLCIAAAVWLYVRSAASMTGRMRFLAGLRSVTMAIIAFILLNPVLTLAA